MPPATDMSTTEDTQAPRTAGSFRVHVPSLVDVAAWGPALGLHRRSVPHMQQRYMGARGPSATYWGRSLNRHLATVGGRSHVATCEFA